MLILLDQTVYVFANKKNNPLDKDNVLSVNESDNFIMITEAPKKIQEHTRLLDQHGFKIEGEIRRERRENKRRPFSDEDIAFTDDSDTIVFCLNKNQDFRHGLQFHGILFSKGTIACAKIAAGDTSAQSAFVDRFFKGWAVAKLMDSKGKLRDLDADKIMTEFSEVANSQLKEPARLIGKYVFTIDKEGKPKYEFVEIK
ncbi:hypothetical protein [Vibrio phage BONAISHI]|nr:hypothetical protein [Vibrio phage BONAISHI]